MSARISNSGVQCHRGLHHCPLLPVAAARTIRRTLQTPRSPSRYTAVLSCQASARPVSKVRAEDTSAVRPVLEPIVEVVKEPTALQRLSTALLKGTAACALAAVLVLTAVSPALAARSGGRVGGSSFSSSHSASSSYRSGGHSSFSSGFRSSSTPSPSLHYSSPSRSALQSPRTGTGGTVLNSVGPLGWGLLPFGGGYSYGYGYNYGYPGTTMVNTGGGFNLGTILILGVAAALLFTLVQNLTSRNDSSEDYDQSGGYEAVERVSVARLQVGLIGSARTLQRRLERIADRADTDSPEGLHYILQETVLELMRNPEYAVYGLGEVKAAGSLEKGEAAFNEASLRERGKIKEETLVNVGGQRKASRMSTIGGSGIQELIVITIIAAVRGRMALPSVTSREELTTALAKLGGVSKDQTLAVEVLWTPQDPDDSYSRDELFMDYPTLNTL